MLNVSLLGDFSVIHNGTSIKDINTPRLQSLLAYLMLHRDAPQPRAHVAYLFWPDTSEDQARTNLRNLLHQLRQVLPQADSYLELSVQTLQWRRDSSYTLDLDEFNSALAHAEQARRMRDPESTRESWELAIVLYKGDLLPSCYDEWIIPQRERLRLEFLSALEYLVLLLEEKREYQAAIHYAQRLLNHDPLHETTYRYLIRLHALNDDRASALRVYHSCTTVLQRELDVGPSPATREAYEHLLGAESRYSSSLPTTTAFSPLVGRDSEWTQILQTWRRVVTGGGAHILMLQGEAGIGKTRLEEDLLQWATRQGISIANARCYAAEGDLAYAPIISWLRANPLADMEDVWLTELARLLPEVLTQRPDLPRPAALTEAWQRQLLFEALSRAILSKSQPILLVIDDLQWCDRDTLEWLHFLLRHERDARFLVLGAYRPEEIGESHPLISLLHAIRPEGLVTEIELSALNEAETATLAKLVAGMDITIEYAQRLYRETEGNPLFIVETVRAGETIQDHKIISPSHDDASPGELGLPSKVRSVLEARIAQLSPPTRELAGLAATIGREFRIKLLGKASGCDQDHLVQQLDELWQRRIVREHGMQAYDFSHDKLREVVYNSMSTARRRLFHNQVAQALEALHEMELDTISHQVASHYERAGEPVRAIPYYLRAADAARQVFANEEAIALLQRGIALTEQIESGEPAAECKMLYVVNLWEGLGDILEMRAQHGEALHAYHIALEHISQDNRIGLARLHRKVGAVRREQRLYIQELEACQQAEAALGEQSDLEDDRWLDEWLNVQMERMWAHYWLDQWIMMDRLVNQLQPFVQQRGSGVNRMRFLVASCLLHLRKDRYVVSDEMLANALEALAESRKWGSLRAQMDCEFELGFMYLWRRELEKAREHLQVALQLAESSGVFPVRTLCLTYLTVLSRFSGQVDEVMDYARRAQESAEVAQMPDYVAAAKGNQAWLSWRKGDLPTTWKCGEEALALWQHSPLVYPFQWQALWPLIGVAMAQNRIDDAWVYVHALLGTTQQYLPDTLNGKLGTAVRRKERGNHNSADSLLEQAIDLARDMGYL